MTDDAFCRGEVAKMSPKSARERLKPVVLTLAMLFEGALIGGVGFCLPIIAL
jgi:hypothetical protein